MSRILAIVGRPNVGKSAVFNRILGRRVAIVHDEPGVTRDRISAEATWRDRRFELIDTGGLGFIDSGTTTDVIAASTRDQARVAIEDAAVIVFVTDITAGITPLDREVAAMLHKSNRTVLLAANKADREALDAQAAEFAPLGFPVFPIAALHNRGFDELLGAATAKLPDEDPPTRAEPVRVAIVGKPNAGKSSLINRVLRSDRVVVSPVPGTTRDSVEVPFVIGTGPQARHFTLVDTAGLRRLRREDEAIERWSVMRAEKSIEDSDIAVLVLDAAQGPSVQDKKIADRIVENHKGCVLLINKWDVSQDAAETRVTEREYEASLRKALPFFAHVPIVFASAKSGYNIRRAIEVIDYVAGQITTKIPTSLLNRVLHDAVQRVQAPLVHQRRMKFYYATQIGVRPIRIRLFVNEPRLNTQSYRSFLVNCLRSAQGLEGAPVVLDFKSSHTQGRDRREKPES